MDPVVIAAIVSAIVSLLVVVISPFLRTVLDGFFLRFKLKTEHIYEQRKKIKEIVTKNKIHLMDASEKLNHRIWNFNENHNKQWHFVSDYYSNIKDDNYYFVSFVYRFISFFAWQKKLDNEMVFLDTTIASKSDLVMIKYFKLFQQIMSDTKLFDGLKYDRSKATDHFFNNNFEEIASSFIKVNAIVSFSHFKDEMEEYIPRIEPIMDFINGVTPKENRYRWEKLQILHICLIAFLNTYGYDYQYTNNDKLKRLAEKYKNNRLIGNFKCMVNEYKLDKQKELKNILNLFNDN